MRTGARYSFFFERVSFYNSATILTAEQFLENFLCVIVDTIETKSLHNLQ